MRNVVAPLAVLIVLSGLPAAEAQVTLRFETNVGSFDMELNPTNDPNLQGHVDNILGYVGLGRYHFAAINRAPEGFVLQMGSFTGFPGGPDAPGDLFAPLDRFDPVVVDADGDGQVDFDTTDLSNVEDTVSLALSNAGPNSGTSSFFINLTDNSFLDNQGFVPFATIPDRTTIDAIMALDKVDLSDRLGQPGSLAFIDIPVTADNRFVVITDIDVVDAPADFSFVEPILAALGIESEQAAAAAAPPAGGATVANVPEPAAGALALLALAGPWLLGRVSRTR